MTGNATKRHESNEKKELYNKLDPTAKKAHDLMFSKHYVLTATIFAYVIGNIVIFAGGGYLLDNLFGTKPLFFVTGFVVSFISTQLTLYLKFKKFQ